MCAWKMFWSTKDIQFTLSSYRMQCLPAPDSPERDRLTKTLSRTNPGVDKEAIEIPTPPERKITVVERILAIIMTGDRQKAQTHGLVGKPLLWVHPQQRL